MAIQKTEAIVLKTRAFRETSLIVNFFTKDYGKMSGLIKGIRQEPQRYGGLPLSFSHNSIVFYEKARRDLNLVTQCDTKEQFLPIRDSLQKNNYATYFIELLDAVTSELDKNENLFELLIRALSALNQHQDSQQVGRIFEIRLLNLSGFKPRLDACVHCQKRIIGEGRFSPALGGILCPHCFRFDNAATAISKGALASIDYIERVNWQKALQLRVSANIAGELKAILSNFLDIHLDKEIKSRKFLI